MHLPCTVVPRYRRAIVFALLACTGCALHRTYRLVKQGTGQVLIPPGVSAPDLAQRTFTADVAAGPDPCPPAEGVIAIQVRKKRVLVTVTRDTLVKQPPGWLSAWTSEIEAQGCLAPGDGLKLADRIAESLPLDPDTAFHLLHSSELDIGPQTRLQVVSPILREGPADDAKILNVETAGNGNNLTVTLKPAGNLIGYETAWYAVQPRANRIGFTIVPLSAERHIQGETERRPQPARNYFQFPADAACYRLFYKADQTEFTALVVAARTRAELDRRIKALETGTASCEKLHGELCVAIPRLIGINPFLAVTVNGSEVMLHWGATVRAAIWQAGEPEDEVVPPHLAVYKLYHGRPVAVKFDRASPAILDLVLTGGEVVWWR
jgi:hypothetical protein